MTIKWNRFLLTACLALIGLSMKTASADEQNKQMDLQFSAPVQVPGHVLQPGKYVFRLADSTPGEIADVQKAVNAADVYKGSIIGETADGSADDIAFL